MRLLSSCHLGAGTSVISEVTNREERSSQLTQGATMQLGPETGLLSNMGTGFFKTIKPKYFMVENTI